MSRTYEDGVLDVLEALNETDRNAHKAMAERVLNASVYKRAQKQGRLRATGIDRIKRQTLRNPMTVTIVAGNNTRH